jgi:hypothetical protein
MGRPRPAARDGARTVLYVTWGYKNGDQSTFANDTYAAMQARVASGYTELGALIHAPVAAVALAWRRALRERPRTPLWWTDSHHPSPAGSYLGACVLYARLTGHDPRGSRFTAGVSAGEAHWLQRIAASSR